MSKGSEGKRMAFCHQCGRPVDDAAAFCTGCGTNLAGIETTESAAGAVVPIGVPAAIAPRRRLPIGLIAAILVCLAAAAIGISILVTLIGNGPADTASTFYRSVADGRLDKAVALVSPQIRGLLGDQKLKAALSEQAGKVRNHGGLKKIHVVSAEAQATVAYVALELTFGDGSVERTRDRLDKIDDKWLIGSDKRLR